MESMYSGLQDQKEEELYTMEEDMSEESLVFSWFAFWL